MQGVCINVCGSFGLETIFLGRLILADEQNVTGAPENVNFRRAVVDLELKCYLKQIHQTMNLKVKCWSSPPAVCPVAETHSHVNKSN